MRLNRFYALLLTALFAANMNAQPYYQKGTRMLQASGSLAASGRGSAISNMLLTSSVGTSVFFTPKTGVAAEVLYRWAPLTQTLQTTYRAQRLLYGRSDLKHSVIADVHGLLRVNMNRTLSGEMFGSNVSGLGAGVQYAYWPNAHLSVYVWPQISRTNGGPSGLPNWEFYAPIGLQWSWLHKR